MNSNRNIRISSNTGRKNQAFRRSVENSPAAPSKGEQDQQQVPDTSSNLKSQTMIQQEEKQKKLKED